MNSKDSINTLVFDWDGTLVDSAELGLRAFQRTFADLSVPFPLEVYEQSYSPNWYLTYEALGLDRDKWAVADKLWLDHYGDQKAQLIGGARETLVELNSRGYRLGVVTSGSQSRVVREIEGGELHEIFDVVICNEQIVHKKPHPEGLEKALLKLSCTCNEAAYIGDAVDDIEMGRNAGVFTVGVRSNYPGNSRLQGSAPNLYLESLSGLLEHFDRK